MIPAEVRDSVINLKGKPYLQVAYRLVWFRDAMPKGRIETELVRLDMEAGFCIFRASIFDEDGTLLAQATKQESRKDFPDFIEKAETGAIGRALGMAGFGTQFMFADLDEGDRLADAPVQPVSRKLDRRSELAAEMTRIVREQNPGMTAEEARAFCRTHVGVNATAAEMQAAIDSMKANAK